MNATQVAEVEQLETHLAQRLGNRVYGLRLLLQEEGLLLQGHAHTYYAKQLAQNELLNATELPLLANAIEVS